MIRNLYSIGFLVSCLGLPLQAKTTVPAPAKPTPITSSKTGVLNPTSTASSSATSAAKQIAPTTASQTKTAKTDNHSDKKSTSLVSKTSPMTPSSVRTSSSSRPEEPKTDGRLARVTAYWAGEGDYYTSRCLSSTGIRLHDGHCAVDPNIIPYGSVVKIAGVGTYLAVDTGSAVISREAAKEAGHTSAERNALVIDIFFESRRDGERFAAAATKYAPISWVAPTASNNQAKEARSLFADEDWGRIHSKQL